MRITNIYNQNGGELIDIQSLPNLFNDCDIKELVEYYRNNKTKEIKKNIPIISLDEKNYYFIDVDGQDHSGGNKVSLEVLREKISLYSNEILCYFVSVGGEGYKILLKTEEPIQLVLKYLSDETSLIIDSARKDISFASYDENIFINKDEPTFIIPEDKKNKLVEKMKIKEKKIKLSSSYKILNNSSNLKMMEIIIDKMEQKYTYNKWLGYIQSFLYLFREDIIPLLEKKWETEVPYETILKSMNEKIVNIDNIFDLIDSNSSILNDSYSSHQRNIICGNTGSGKTEYIIKNNLSNIKDDEYIFYVRKSVTEMVELKNRLSKNNIPSTILVSENTANKNGIEYVGYTSTAKIRIISLTSYLCGDYKKYMTPIKKLKEIIIDELVIDDILVPSYKFYDIFVNKEKYDDSRYDYLNKFRKNDKQLIINGHPTMVSEAYYPPCDLSILTTEITTIELLNNIGFKKTIIPDRVDVKKCKIKLHLSKYLIRESLKSDEIKNIIKTHDFVIGNCLKNNEKTINFIKSKGGDTFTGKKVCSIIRNYDKTFIDSMKMLSEGFIEDVEAKLYLDDILQSSGRTLGNRGGKSFDVYIHFNIWEKIKNIINSPLFPYQYEIVHFEFSENTIKELKEKKKNDYQNDKLERIRNKTLKLDQFLSKNTLNIITKKDLPQGLTLLDIQMKLGGVISTKGIRKLTIKKG